MNIDAKSSTKYWQTEPNNTLKGSYTMIKWDLSQRCKDFSISIKQSVGYTTSTNWRIKNYMIISIDAWKAFDKIQIINTHLYKNSTENGLSTQCAVLSCSVLSSLCSPMDCSPPGFSVHGIFWARILEWVAISFSTRYSWRRDWMHVSCIGRWILYHWAMWETRREHTST